MDVHDQARLGAEARFVARAQAAVQMALQSRVEGDPAWDSFLASLGLAPGTCEERLALQRQGVPNLKGALPVELRQALQAIRGEVLRGLGPLEDAPLRLKLDTLLDREVREYLNQCRPRVTLKGIFANAQATTVRLGDAPDTVKALTCRCCGAARPENSNPRVCAFCGADLFAGGEGR